VVQGLQLIGLVTDRDLRQALPSPITTLTPDEMTYKMATIAIATCMTREVITVPPEVDIVQGTRRLSVLLLARYEAPALLMTMRVKDLMTTDVYTATEETTVATAGQLFLDHKLGCLPVVDTDHRLAGIVTVTDLLHAYVALQQNRVATP
jgi:CBS domain-containing protein